MYLLNYIHVSIYPYIFISMNMFLCIHKSIYVYVFVYGFIHFRKCTHTRTQKSTFTLIEYDTFCVNNTFCVCVCLYVCVCVCVCMCIYIYLFIIHSTSSSIFIVLFDIILCSLLLCNFNSQ